MDFSEVKLRVRYSSKRHDFTFPGTKTIGEVGAFCRSTLLALQVVVDVN